MDPNEMLLHEALIARDTLAELQDEVDRRRLAYYQAVRHLHFSGASMRDIAEEHGVFVSFTNLVASEGGKSFPGGATIAGASCGA